MTENKIREIDEEDTDPYILFLYAIRSPYTKESYFRLLRRFFQAIYLCKDETFENVVMPLLLEVGLTPNGLLTIFWDFTIPKDKI